jgi:hypothetical protein
MALFTVNAGCRSGETCQLRWEWETLASAGDRSKTEFTQALQAAEA